MFLLHQEITQTILPRLQRSKRHRNLGFQVREKPLKKGQPKKPLLIESKMKYPKSKTRQAYHPLTKSKPPRNIQQNKSTPSSDFKQLESM